MADGERFAGHSFPWAFPGFEKVGLAMLQVMANKAANCLVCCDAYLSKSKKLLPSGAGQTWSCVALVAVLENERPFVPLAQLTL